MRFDLSTGLALFGALATASNLLNAWLTNGVRLEISTLKLEIADRRSADKEWMAEKFATRAEVDQRFQILEARIGIKLH